MLGRRTYQLTIARMPLAKEIEGSPINEALVRDLATGAFLAEQQRRLRRRRRARFIWKRSCLPLAHASRRQA